MSHCAKICAGSGYALSENEKNTLPKIKLSTTYAALVPPLETNKYACFLTLQWRHNGGYSVSNHQPHDCLLNRLFRRRSNKTSKLRFTGLCAGNSPLTGEFPAQMASNTESFLLIMSSWYGTQLLMRIDATEVSSNLFSKHVAVCHCGWRMISTEHIEAETKLPTSLRIYSNSFSRMTIVVFVIFQ